MPEVRPIKLTTSGDLEEIGATDTIPASALPVSVITPSQITSDQDNYNPTGFSSATIVRLSGDSTIRAITGFSAGNDGAEKLLINVGDNPIYFPGQHPDSTAANRINVPHDIMLFPKQAAKLVYDGTASRWMLFLNYVSNIDKSLIYETSAASVTAGDWGDITFTSFNSGATGSANATLTLPACWQLVTNTLSNGGAYILSCKNIQTPGYFGKQHAFSSVDISIPVLSNSTDSFVTYFSIMAAPASSTAAANNQIGIRYSDSINSGKFECFTRNNAGSESTADSGITVSANTVYNLRIELDKAFTEARFYINGSFVSRITGTLPTASAFGVRLLMLKTLGTVSVATNLHKIKTVLYF